MSHVEDDDAFERGERIPRAEDLPDAEPPASAGQAAADVFASKWKTLGEWGPDWLISKPPPRRWLLERNDRLDGGALPFGKVGMLVAAGGVGKTMALAQLALAVACGETWLGTFKTPSAGGHVVLALGEEDEEEVRRRLFNTASSMKLKSEQLRAAAERIIALPLAGTPVGLTQSDGRATVETPTLAALRKRLEGAGHDWSLIIMDPLSRFAGCDTEKDNAAATRFIEAAESLTKMPGSPTVLLAHHTNKAERTTDSGSSSSADARGASGLTDGVRWVANLKSHGDGHAEFAVTKSNYSLKGDAIALVRDSQNYGALRLETTEERKQRIAKEEELRQSKKSPGSASNGASQRDKPKFTSVLDDD